MKSIPRLTSSTYIPTDDDILHVRIMTMGVVEHAFKIPLPTTHKGLSFSSPFRRSSKQQQTHTSSITSSLEESTSIDSGSVKTVTTNGDLYPTTPTSSSSSSGNGKFINMHIYDVGGARGQRHTWASFFEGATAVSFSPSSFPIR